MPIKSKFENSNKQIISMLIKIDHLGHQSTTLKAKANATGFFKLLFLGNPMRY